MPDEPTLADKMDALADSGHVRGEELREKAKELREGVEGFYAEPQTVSVKSFLGRWARARKLWCEVTGEPLI